MESGDMKQENITEAIKWLQTTAGQIQDFAVEQAPLYCQEIVAWTFWHAMAGIALGVAFILVPVIFIYNFRKVILRDLSDAGHVSFFAGVFGFFSLVAGVACICKSAPQAIKAHVAPRIVIIEHLQGLTK
jgi:hypothetical protein